MREKAERWGILDNITQIKQDAEGSPSPPADGLLFVVTQTKNPRRNVGYGTRFPYPAQFVLIVLDSLPKLVFFKFDGHFHCTPLHNPLLAPQLVEAVTTGWWTQFL